MGDWKKIISSIAPTVATALGGPLAGTATKYLATALLGDENGTEDQIAAAIQTASPETLAKLKSIDAEFKTEMKRLDVDIERISVDNTKSARELAKINMWPQIILSVIFIGGYFTVVFSLFSGKVVIDESIRDMSNILLGVLTANIPSIMQFWFGSSHGSKQKSYKRT